MDEDGFLYLSDADLAGLGVTAVDIADAIEATLAAKARGEVWTAPKTATLPGDGRYMMATLAASDAAGLIAVKSVMVSPDNPARGLPSITGAILLLDSQTGALRAVLDAGFVTGARTAALSLVAARRLADPAAATIAFVGCGVQASSHLDAFRRVFPLRRVRAHGRGEANVARLCALAEDLGLEAARATTPEEALAEADIVVTSVTLDYAIAPFLDARLLRPGAFAAITDLAIPWLPESLPAFARLYVDDAEQEASAERPMVPPELISGDLSDLIGGGPAFDAGERTAFVFRGLAIGDLAAAALAYERARAGGAGRRVEA